MCSKSDKIHFLHGLFYMLPGCWPLVWLLGRCCVVAKVFLVVARWLISVHKIRFTHYCDVLLIQLVESNIYIHLILFFALYSPSGSPSVEILRDNSLCSVALTKSAFSIIMWIYLAEGVLWNAHDSRLVGGRTTGCARARLLRSP